VPWTKEAPVDRERLWAECEHLSVWHDTQIPATAHANP
jgi:hypothetical protein